MPPTTDCGRERERARESEREQERETEREREREREREERERVVTKRNRQERLRSAEGRDRVAKAPRALKRTGLSSSKLALLLLKKVFFSTQRYSEEELVY